MLSKMKSGMPLFTTLVMVSIATKLSGLSLRDLYVHHCQHLEFDVRHWVMISLSVVGLLAVIYHFLTNARPVYLVNFACYKPEDSCKCTKQRFMNCSSASGTFTEESLEFQRKVIDKSGLGDSTYLPEVLLTIPSSPSISMTQARAEAEAIIFGSVDQLFAKTNVNPKEIGILIVNCSLFCPTPSLSAMVVNHYKLRSNIMSYNIAGMGCSAGVISIELAQSLLQVHEASYALVVTAETAALNWYSGNERSMLVSNCLFRMGAAAILLSNKRSDKRRSKYQLLHTVRTHKGADDNSFTCVVQREDSEGNLGIALSKELMGVAGDALKANITSLGPLVLPISEKLQFLATLIGKKVFGMKKLKPYIPDFKLAFEHFCIHSGGKAVLDGVEKNLRLSKWHMEPSRMTLYRFGNTSSSSIWYELAYTEAKGRVKRGDRIWQIAFGSGFKCNSQVWKALRTVRPTQEKNPWMDEINSFPVDVPL